MSYQIQKLKVGQEVVKKLTFKLNKCKYSEAPYTVENVLRNERLTPISPLSFNIEIVVSQFDGSNWLSTWSGFSSLYGKIKGEIIRFEPISSTSIKIVERGCFGTTAIQIDRRDSITIYHEGYFDGSCYGYSQTCSNADSYQTGLFKEIVFATSPLAAGSVYHAGLDFKALNYQSAEINPGETMGSRAKLSFSISDQTHNDYDLVPYPDRRTVNGTLFGKLIARNPFFNNRELIYSVGLRKAGTLDEPEWEHRNFIIDTVNLSDGRFTGSALDPLILTEGKKAKMPLVSPAQLTEAITSSSTSVKFANAPTNYFGTSGNIIIRIDSELLEVTANNTLTMPIVSRGFGHSAIKDHSVNATVQNCIRFINEHLVNCITYALTTWTDISPSFLDDYSATIAKIPDSILTDYVLSTPTDVFEFINRCIFIGNLIFYFDEITNKIVIKYIDEQVASPIYINENDHIKKNSSKINLNNKEQYTRFNLMWAPFDRSKETDENNFQISLTAANLDIESPQKMGTINERKKVLTPLLNASSADFVLGATAVNRIISNSKQSPVIFECELDAETIGDTQDSVLELGTVVNLQSRENQNKAGIGKTELFQLLKISGDAFDSFKVKFKRFQALTVADVDFSIDAGTYVNYVLTDHFSPTIAGEYTVLINTGAIFGSYNTAIAAFRTGTPSAGVTFKIIARWQVLGMGGAGGSFGYFSPIGGGGSVNPTDGAVGGLAFEANCNCTIDNGSGLIWGGGGGGAAEKSQNFVVGQWTGAKGGGGGQGFGNSAGGSYTTGSSSGPGSPPTSAGLAMQGSQSGPGNNSVSVAGGEWGENGTLPGTQGDSQGGLAGIAIKSNGFNVNIIAGDNPLSIRGRRT